MWNGGDMDQRIVVVGASGVLGSGISQRLVASGARVVGTASNMESLERIPSGVESRWVLHLDDPASIAAVTSGITETEGVDGVVIASGIVAFGAISETPPEVADELMQVNHLGPASVIARLLPALSASAEAGRHPFVASICGVVAERVFPGMAAYAASKTAHSTWLKALRMEVRRPAIRVIDARPGHTETGLAGRAIFGLAPRMPQGMDPAHVADVIVGAISGDATDVASEAFGS